jgi:hypothetical protein
MDLSSLAPAIDKAAENGRPIALGYVDDTGYPRVSFRGSIHVYSPTQIGLWAREAEGRFIESISARPGVSFLYWNPHHETRYLTIRGRARVAPDANDAVYAAMPQQERDTDADRKGVAVIVDVESVNGFSGGAPVELSA